MKNIKVFECILARENNEISSPVSKIGGKPVLLEHLEWPECKQCGKDMNFIGQISLKHPIKFSDVYSMAYIFMCLGEYDEEGLLKCETWDVSSGANAVVLQTKGESFLAQAKGEILPNYSIEFEEKKEPNIDSSDYEIDEDILESVVRNKKIGGVPAWLQNNETPICSTCGKEMKFVAQISSELDGPLSANPNDWVAEDKKFLDFGGDGMGYLFVCKDNCNNNGVFLWQCS